MPSREIEPKREPETEGPYVRSARYSNDQLAFDAYSQAQGVLHSADCDLSAYRIRLRDVPHVVVVGIKPPDDIDRKLVGILENGEPASLPPDIITTLNQRRQAARRIGPWVEGHYRPGKPV